MKLAIVIFIVLAQAAFSAEEVVMAVTESGQLPFHMKPSKGDLVQEGVVYELMQIFQKEYPKYKITMRGMPRFRQEEALEKGTAAFTYNSPLFVKGKRDQFLWSLPIIKSRDCLVMLKKDKFNFNSPSDLFGKVIGTMRGYGYGEYDKYIDAKKIKTIPVNETELLIQMLKTKRIDAFFGNIFVTPYDLKKAKEKMDDFEFSQKSLYEFEYLFQVIKSKPQLKNDLDEFIARAQKRGLIEKLTNRYKN